jgi:hypothetical protein
MGSDEKSNKNPPPYPDPFTFNSEKTREVPSLNLLLNRKKLTTSKVSQVASEIKPLKPTQGTHQEDASQISISQMDSSDFQIEISGQSGEIATQPKEETKPGFKIQKAQRKLNIVPHVSLEQWELSNLKTGTDLLGKALVYLFEKGATNALFLGISPPPPGSTIPLFISSATVEPKERLTLWMGLQWDPRVVPEVWNFFLKTGIVEFAPPGTMTNVMSTRNVIRGAFGVDQSEWLSLLRVGELKTCRGVVALLSKSSLQLPLRQAMRIINNFPEKQAV